jgi:hypothetical protein
LFGDEELRPLATLLQHSLANEEVNRYINETLRERDRSISSSRTSTEWDETED